MKTIHRALLAVPPLLGLILVARVGANRPERLIVGKWQTGAPPKAPHPTTEDVPPDTIVFRSNGTYERSNGVWSSRIGCGPPLMPVTPGEVPSPPKPAEPAKWIQQHDRGRYYFDEYDTLVMKPEPGDGHGVQFLDPGLANGFQSDTARVGNEVWKRIE